MSTRQTARGPFVGRETQFGALTEAMAAAEVGESVLVLIAGEPGIGKSRLVTELASRVSMSPAWAACWEGDGAPPYWPWRQLLRALATDHGDQIGEVIARLDGVEQDGNGRDARFELFDAVADGFAQVSQRQPLMLVLDDLQWADEESIRLLQFVAADRRPRRLAIIGTYRDTDLDETHPLTDALPSLARQSLHLVLGGLSPHDVAALASADATDPRSDATVAQLHRRSGGNPFYLFELLRLDRDTPPPNVRAAVLQRMFVLSPASREVLTVAAVVGGDAPVVSLAGLLGQPSAAVLTAVQPAMDAGLAEVIDGRFRFVHDLVREVTYDDLDLTTRADWHRRAAEQLQREGQDNATAVAHHLFEAAVHEPDEECIAWAIKAAEQATHSHAYADAARWYERASTALPPADPRQADLLLRYGAAALTSGRTSDARTAYERAAILARTTGEADLLAQAALGLGAGLGGFEIQLLDPLQIDLLTDALAARGDEPSSLRAWLLARLSIALSLVADETRRRDLSAEAVAVARSVDDPRALGYALAASCDAMAGPDACDHRVRASAEIVDLGARTGDRELELLGLRLRIVALLEVGDVGAADAAVDRYELITERLRQPLYRWYVPLWRGTRALMRGEFDAAARYTAEAEQLGEEAGSGNSIALTFTQWWVRRRYEGHVKEAGSAMATLLANPDVAAQVTAGPRAVIAAMTGDLGKARVLLAEWLASGLADRTRDSEWLPESAQLAQVAVAAGATDLAERLYADLTPYASRYCVEGIGAAVTGSVSWYLAHLATFLGRDAEARRHAEQARVAHDRIGLLGNPPPLTAAISSTTPTRPAGPSLINEGVTWAVTWNGSTSRVRDSKGLRDLARLLIKPHTDVHCLELIGGSDVGGDTGPALDEQARRAYEQRIRDLQADIDEANQHGDLGQAERAEEELDALVTQLAQAYGLSGRSRSTGSPAERARSAVSWRVRAAIRNLGEVQPELARHLRNAVRTGAWCSYRPETDPGWAVRSA